MTEQSKPVHVIVTGASRGIGLELVKQYCAKPGYSVTATCRQPDKAGSLISMTDRADNIRVKALDVTKPESVSRFVENLGERPIDILINNAGMYGPNAPLLPVDVTAWHEVFHLNCVAPVFLTQQLLQNVRQSNLKKVVTISSDMGSISENRGGGAYLYRSSKAGLNAAMFSLSLDLKPMGITVMMLHPGHVKTDMGGPNAKVELSDSVGGLVKVIADVDLMRSGSFLDWQGKALGW